MTISESTYFAVPLRIGTVQYALSRRLFRTAFKYQWLVSRGPKNGDDAASADREHVPKHEGPVLAQSVRATLASRPRHFAELSLRAQAPRQQTQELGSGRVQEPTLEESGRIRDPGIQNARIPDSMPLAPLTTNVPYHCKTFPILETPWTTSSPSKSRGPNRQCSPPQ